jgi:hypothetical protein
MTREHPKTSEVEYVKMKEVHKVSKITTQYIEFYSLKMNSEFWMVAQTSSVTGL